VTFIGPRRALLRPNRGALRLPPSGFGWTPDFRIYKRGSSFASSFNIDGRMPAKTVTYRIGSSGNNANDGLSSGAKVRSVKQAITLGNLLTAPTPELVIDDGNYFKSSVDGGGIPDCWDGLSPDSDVNLIVRPAGSGKVHLIRDVAVPAFVSSGQANIYVSTYTTETISRSVLDMAFTESGRYHQLWSLLSTDVANRLAPWPELNAAWSAHGSACFVDTTAKKIFVRLPDNRAPDSNVRVLTSGNEGNWVAADNTIWMDRILFYGGVPFNVAGGLNNLPKFFAKECGFHAAGAAAADGGLTWKAGGEAYLVRSAACRNGLDGFNGHCAPGGGLSPKFYGEDCIGDENGWLGGGANNGWTFHEAAINICLNSSFRDNADRSVHNIGTSQTWLLGVRSGPSRNAGTGSYNFGCGRSGQNDAARMWLDSCISDPGTRANGGYDLLYGPTSILRYADIDVSAFNNLTGGTLESYVA
jgi:hypothetical protein